MNNDRLSMEEARERISQRRREVEMYARDQQLGYRDHGLGRWVIAFAVIVIVILAIGLFL
jgi:hypothetical protein